jgi:Asp-tRNA(Asn)/Glu-tRNA(Gln) amidotransferase A subunit family amidase
MSVPSNFLTATETVALVKSGALTVTQVALDHLARYDERDPTIHAWAYLNRDLILSEAKRLDAIPPEERGPLHGVMLGVKDMIREWAAAQLWTTGFCSAPAPTLALLSDALWSGLIWSDLV